MARRYTKRTPKIALQSDTPDVDAMQQFAHNMTAAAIWMVREYCIRSGRKAEDLGPQDIEDMKKPTQGGFVPKEWLI